METHPHSAGPEDGALPGRRRRLAPLLVVLGGGLALLLAALWLVPPLFDWTARRGDLAALSAARLGRSVTLTGPVRLALLPAPVVEAEGATIGGEEEDIALAARALRIRLDPFALLLGRVEPREIVLIGADLRLPWPPAPFAALLWPEGWAARLAIRIEESRLRLGGFALSGLSGRIAAGGGEGMEADLAFLWNDQRGRISARLSPAPPLAPAPLVLDLAVPSARLRLRGELPPEGGFAGEAEILAEDLSRFLPAAPLRLAGFGRLLLGGEEARLEGWALDLGGAPASGSATFRFEPTPRLEVSLDAARLDLDPWIAALERAAPPSAALALSLAAETASLRGLPLRRVRAQAHLSEGRLDLPAVSFLLPGDMVLAASGRGEGGRVELAGRLAGADLRALAAAVGVPEAVLSGLPPAALRWGAFDWRAVVEAGQIALPEIAGRLDGAAISGAASLRFGPRPRLGLGLSVDRLDLGLYRPRGLGAAEALALLAGIDAELRLAAEQVVDGPLRLERASLDAALEGGRLLLRRAAAGLAGAQATLSGQVLPPERPGGALRIAELIAEIAAPRAAPPAAALLAAVGATLALPPIAEAPFSLRLSGGGPADALALAISGEIEALRLEAAPRLDLHAGTLAGRLTLRHPGAARLLALLSGEEGWGWIGDGSFSLVASGALAAGRVTLDAFDLVAGEARLSGSLSLAGGDRPSFVARLAAEVLPLPAPPLVGAAPLPLGWLFWGEGEMELRAERLPLRGGPVLEQVTARLALSPGSARLGGVSARLAGGHLVGAGGVTVAGWLPRLDLSVRLAGAALTTPLFGLPLDLSAGQFDLAAEITAAGHSPAAMAASLAGSVELEGTNGVLVGFDLPAAVLSASLADPAEAAAGIGAALAAGATAFERLRLRARLSAGRAVLEAAELVAEGGGGARAEGQLDIPRRLLDLVAEMRAGEGVAFGLRLFGPAEAPQRAITLPEALRRRALGP